MVQVLFRAARSRNPLARLALGALGLIVIALFVTVGVFALAALVVGGGLLLLVNALRAAPRQAASADSASVAQPAPPDVIEGEFKVVSAMPTARDPQSRPD